MLQVISTLSLLVVKFAVILYSTMCGVSLMKDSARGTEMLNVCGNILAWYIDEIECVSHKPLETYVLLWA